MGNVPAPPWLIWLAPPVVAVLILVLGTHRPADPTLYPARPGAQRVTVFVINNGFHTDLAIPAGALAAVPGPAAEAAATMNASPWVSFGWGDEAYYTSTGVSAARAADGVRALFGWNNPSVVMMEPLRAAPDLLYREGVTRLDLSPDGFAGLERRLNRSYRLSGGHPVAFAASGWGDARFFRSAERFSALHVCNNWAGELLNAAGIATRPVLDTFAQGLAMDVERAVKLDRTARGR